MHATFKNSLAFAAMLATAIATAAAPPPPGRLLASNCFQCHGTNGAGPGFDTLAGKSARSIYEDMKEMQAGQEGEDIMSKHSRGYTDEQLQLLAQWLSLQGQVRQTPVAGPSSPQTSR
ncbi:c-type cytochrome [Ideonella sp. YS5]|uniref:c-type cytochrome n=1 Tax=Ideonella sp. YS5 TaxID=3453714 RepID=UPI003EEF8159